MAYSKTLIFSLLFSLIFLSACGSTPTVSLYQQTLNDGHYVGELSESELFEKYPKFATAYEAFEPTRVDLDAALKLKDKDLVVLFGTWCHDSKREVPKMLKILERSNVALSSLKLIAVDYEKRVPQDITELHNLKFTPTFVLLDENREVGRVVERPQLSLVLDLQSQLAVN